MYRKKGKLNPVIEQEETIETEKAIVIRDDTPTPNTEETPLPSSSRAEIIQKKNSAEISTSSKPVEKEKDIIEKYKEIKIKSEALKVVTYAKYQNQAPSDQSRLLSGFYLRMRKMQMTFLHPKVHVPKTSEDYNSIDLEYPAKDVHTIDQIEFHRSA